MSDVAAPLFRAVDRAAFAVALGQRLRAAGVPVTSTALSALTEGLAIAPPHTVTALYWLCRVTLVHQPHDLATFDRLVDLVFRDSGLFSGGKNNAKMLRLGCGTGLVA